MKSLLFIAAVTMLVSCSPRKTADNEKFSEDYVLIEFASKLEEEYHRLHNTPYTHEHAHPPVQETPAGDEILIEEMHAQ